MRLLRTPCASCALVPLLVAAALALPALAATGAPPPSEWRVPLLFSRGDDVWIRSAKGERLLLRKADAAIWSPDHRRVAFLRGNDLWLADVDGRRQRQLGRLATSPSAVIGDLCWNPKGPWIAFDRSDEYRILASRSAARRIWGSGPTKRQISSIYVVRVPNGGASTGAPDVMLWLGNTTGGLTAMSLTTTCAPAYAPDGNKLVFSRNGDLWIAEAFEEGDRQWANDIPYAWGWLERRLAAVAEYDGGSHGSNWTAGVTSTAWSRDGRWIAYDLVRLFGSGRTEVWLMDATNPSVRKRVGTGIGPCFDPTGKWVVFGGRIPEDATGDQTPGIWAVSVLDGTRKLLVRNASAPSW